MSTSGQPGTAHKERASVKYLPVKVPYLPSGSDVIERGRDGHLFITISAVDSFKWSAEPGFEEVSGF